MNINKDSQHCGAAFRCAFQGGLLFGNLNNSANYGRRYANLNNTLGNANWNYGARISDYHCVLCFAPLEGAS